MELFRVSLRKKPVRIVKEWISIHPKQGFRVADAHAIQGDISTIAATDPSTKVDTQGKPAGIETSKDCQGYHKHNGGHRP